jgi:hypothetical protein
MIVEELYDALVEAGASEAKARAAARAIADMEGHFTGIRNDISVLDQKISLLRSDVAREMSELRSYVNQRFTQVDGTLRLHNWMLATNLAFIVAVFFKLFSR